MNKTFCVVLTVVAMGAGTAATAAKSVCTDDEPRPSMKSLHARQKAAARRAPRPARVAPAVPQERQPAPKEESEKPSSRLDRRHA